MKAKSNKPYPINAFTGREYVPYEWRDVPAGKEDEAQRNPYLELLDDEPETPAVEHEPEAAEAAPLVEVEPAAVEETPAPAKNPTARRRKKAVK
jgi:hypothetical protein